MRCSPMKVVSLILNREVQRGQEEERRNSPVIRRSAGRNGCSSSSEPNLPHQQVEVHGGRAVPEAPILGSAPP